MFTMDDLFPGEMLVLVYDHDLSKICLSILLITDVEVEGIDDASVIIRHLSVGITVETVLKPIVTNFVLIWFTLKNSVNLIHAKK